MKAWWQVWLEDRRGGPSSALAPVVLVGLALASGCAPAAGSGSRDTGLQGLAITRVDPELLLPGTRLVVSGHSFVDVSLGQIQLRMVGEVEGSPVDALFDPTLVSSSRLELSVDDGVIAALGGRLEGSFTGSLEVEVRSTVDHQLHRADPLAVELALATELVPSLDAAGDGLSFVNHPVEVVGGGLLLGGDEGETRAVLSGCFTAASATDCVPVGPLEIPAVPAAAFDRRRATFPYRTSISGIGPGVFSGTLGLKNVLQGGKERSSTARPVRFDVQPPAILSVTPGASLGQYVFIRGGGFVGDAADEVSAIALTGSFAPASGAAARPFDLELVPEFVAGPELRYVLDEQDPLGRPDSGIVDLRKESGTILATIKPIVRKGTARVEGIPIPISLEIRPVKQVVHLQFLPSFVASLREFGLRAADPILRDRVLQVARRDYDGTNVEFRETAPEDFALYAQVEIAGPDPNAQGLLGYDNSPGKDSDNVRLYDRIGGVNATTQLDGYPGYGGIFAESFFGFSLDPMGLATQLPQATASFDAIFDPFRVARGGRELTATELADLAPEALSSGAGCPAAKTDRSQQIACAVFVLGNLIGTTLTHEVGHSLGLANPHGNGFHDKGDLPNRLMESGSARPFAERAELFGEGPALFCTEAFFYLGQILPVAVAPPPLSRPPCD